MARTHDADIDLLTRLAKAQGWRVERTNGGHIKFVPFDKSKDIVVTGGTPGDWRRSKKLRSDLRRQGLVIER